MADSPVVPHHIAIVMDGNGRWATRRFLPRLAGHKQGVDSLRRCARACVQRGVGCAHCVCVFFRKLEPPRRRGLRPHGAAGDGAGARGAPAQERRRASVILWANVAGLSPKVRDGLASGRSRHGGQHPPGAQRLLQLRRPLGHRAGGGIAGCPWRAHHRGQSAQCDGHWPTCPTPTS